MFSEEEVQEIIEKVRSGHPEAVDAARITLIQSAEGAEPEVLAMMLTANHEIGKLIEDHNDQRRINFRQN